MSNETAHARMDLLDKELSAFIERLAGMNTTLKETAEIAARMLVCYRMSGEKAKIDPKTLEDYFQGAIATQTRIILGGEKHKAFTLNKKD